MENKEIKKEEPDYTGQEFLLNNDKQHKDLLAELNQKIRKCPQNLFLYKDYRGDLEKQTEDIAKFIGNHYRTFIARLQCGVDQLLLAHLFAKNEDGTFKYKDAFKFLKEAEDRGLILVSVDGEKVYLIDPSNLNNNTVKMIIKNRIAPLQRSLLMRIRSGILVVYSLTIRLGCMMHVN